MSFKSENETHLFSWYQERFDRRIQRLQMADTIVSTYIDLNLMNY